TAGTPAAAYHTTSSLPGIAGNSESIQYHSCQSQCLLGPFPLDWHFSAGTAQSGDSGRLCWQHGRLHPSSLDWQTTASHRLSPCDLVLGAQTRCVCCLPLSG